EEEDAFGGEGAGNRVPQPEPNVRPVDPDRHVGSMRDPVEDPVADDARTEEKRRAEPSPRREPRAADRDPPRGGHQRPAAPRIRFERARGHLRFPGLDGAALDPPGPEPRPPEIEPLRRDQERPERRPAPSLRLRSDRPPRQRDPEMPDEHARILRIPS